MNTIGRLLSIVIAGLLLTGCIEQEVQIKLNVDGSGTLRLMRYLSDMESGVTILGEEPPPSLEALTVLRHSIKAFDEKPGRKVEEAEYAFSNLGKALSELENLVPLMPRFSVQSNQLTVAVRHEMNEYHGFSSENETNAFYNLTIEFPAPPQSETGRVEGNSVSWKATAKHLKEFRKSKIGTVLFECNIPATAVQLDLTPRLVREKKEIQLPGQTNKEPRLVSSLNVMIPIIAKNSRSIRDDSNADMNICLPVGSDHLPLCYKNMTVTRLIIDGQTVVPELKSETSGVFFGTDPQGQKAPGIPLALKFGWNSHLLKRIDRIEASMDSAVPAKTSLHTLEVDATAATNSVFTFADNPNERIAVLEIAHVFSQSAKLKLVTNLTPTDLSMVYLDTEYGLRYPAKGINWMRGKNINFMDQKLGENVFGKDTPFSIVEIYYPHIPTTSFQLTFVRVEELAMKKIVLMEENINVY